MVCANHENNKHEIYFTTNDHHGQYIFVHGFTAQLAISCETASSLIPDGDSWQTCENNCLS